MQGQITGNAATAYANAVTYVDSRPTVNTSQLSSNLANYQTTAGLAANVATLTANNSTNFDGLSLTTVQSQITGNAATAYANAVANAAALYQTTAGLSANVATLTANNSTNFGGVSLATVNSAITGNAATAYTNAVTYVDSRPFVNTSQLSSNLANYQTTAGLAANVATLTANNSTNFDGLSLTTVQGQITGNAATAYTNATAFSSNATNITSGTVAEARLPFRMDQNVRSTDSVNFGSVTISGNLVVNGSYTVVTGNSVVYTDNMLFLNQGISANIANIVANGTHIVFTANNNYQVGWDVLIAGVDPSSYNGLYLNITASNTTSFTVANTKTGAYVSGGTARGQTESNPDIGIAAGYNDGTYAHTGFFRDHSSGVWKVFSGYLPEPDSSIYIDQTNASFTIAPFQASELRVGNNSSYGVVNTTNFTGTSNNALNLGGIAAASYVNTAQLSANLALYQTSAGLSANVATLTANNSTNLGGIAAASYVNTSQLSANLALYQTSAGLAANVATLTANNSTNLGGIAAASYVNTSQLSSNLALYQTSAGLSANVATLTANNSTNFNSQPASFYTNATNITTGTLPDARLSSAVVNTSGNFTITGMQTFANGITFANTVTANGSNGTAGHVLTSSGSTGNVYWAPAASGFTNGQSISVNNFVITGAFTANGSNGSAGQILISNGAGSYWGPAPTGGGGTVTQVSTGSGLTGGPVTTTGTVSVLANTGIVANATGVYVNSAYIATLDANNATNFGGLSLATVQSQITGNAATAYTNAVAYVDSRPFVNTSQLSSNLTNYQTAAGLSANVATLTSNNSTNFGGLSLATVQGQITGNAATAYTNAVAYVDSRPFVNTSQLSSNLALYQTTAGLSANVATLTSNNSTHFDGQTLTTIQSQISGNASTAYTNAVNYVTSQSFVNTAQLSSNLALYQTSASLAANVLTLTSNNSTNFDGLSLATVQGQITGNAATAYTNAVAYVDSRPFVNTTQLSSNLANYQTTAGLVANVATLTSNNSTNFDGLSLATVQGQITGNATTAFTNATNFASNATNITTGTLPNARLSSAVVNTSGVFSYSGIQTYTANTNFQNFIDVRTYVEVESAPTISAGTLTLDLATSTIFDVALNSNITTLTINNISATALRVVNFVLVLTADGTARSVVWPVSFRWPGGITPTITSTNGKRDIFSFMSTDNGTSWNAFVSGQNL